MENLNDIVEEKPKQDEVQELVLASQERRARELNPNIKFHLVGFLQPRVFKDNGSIEREDFCLTAHEEDHTKIGYYEYMQQDFTDDFRRVFRRFSEDSPYKMKDINYNRVEYVYNLNSKFHKIFSDSKLAMMRLAEAQIITRNEKIMKVPKTVHKYRNINPKIYNPLVDIESRVENYTSMVETNVKDAQAAVERSFERLEGHIEEAKAHPDTMVLDTAGNSDSNLRTRDWYEKRHDMCLKKIAEIRSQLSSALGAMREFEDDVTSPAMLSLDIPTYTMRREEVEVPINRWYFEFKHFSISIYDPHTTHELEKIMPQVIEMRESIEMMRELKVQGVPEEDRTYKTKGMHDPYAHQHTMHKVHSSLPFSANLSDMGTGKTYGVLMAIDTRFQRGELKRWSSSVLVVCPNTVVPNWVKEAKIHTPHLKVRVVKGRGIERALDMFMGADESDILITNYETFSMKFKIRNRDGKRLTLRMADFLESKKWGMVVLDECHKIKNPQAKRTGAILQCFVDSDYKVIMTGTINANTLADIYIPFYFLNEGAQFSTSLNHANSNKRIAMTSLRDNFTEEYSVGSKKLLDEMTDMMASVSVQFSKADCLDLPEKVYRIVDVEMEPNQRKLYDKIERHIMLELQEEINETGRVNPTSSFGKIMKLCEAANGWIYDNQKRPIKFPWNPKMKTLLECVDEINFSHSKLVVWCRFVNDIHLIAQELRNKFGYYAVSSIHGGGRCHTCGSPTTDDRYYKVQQFNDLKSEVKIMVIASQVGSHGIDLTGADHEIFYSNSYSKTDRLQAEDRCHRSGMRESLTIQDLIVKNSIDEDIKMALDYHKTVTQALMERLGAKEGLEWNEEKQMFVRAS